MSSSVVCELKDWLENSYEKYPGNGWGELWLPEYPVFDDAIDDDFFMPLIAVVSGNTRGNIELPRIIKNKIQSSYTVDYCQGCYRKQSAHGFSKREVYQKTARECPLSYRCEQLFFYE